MLDTFVSLDGNMIDTASVYAYWLNMRKSMSKKTVGKWLKSRGCRENIIISTKPQSYDRIKTANAYALENGLTQEEIDTFINY